VESLEGKRPAPAEVPPASPRLFPAAGPCWYAAPPPSTMSRHRVTPPTILLRERPWWSAIGRAEEHRHQDLFHLRHLNNPAMWKRNGHPAERSSSGAMPVVSARPGTICLAVTHPGGASVPLIPSRLRPRCLLISIPARGESGWGRPRSSSWTRAPIPSRHLPASRIFFYMHESLRPVARPAAKGHGWDVSVIQRLVRGMSRVEEIAAGACTLQIGGPYDLRSRRCGGLAIQGYPPFSGPRSRRGCAQRLRLCRASD